jgi:cell division transport system permease protein
MAIKGEYAVRESITNMKRNLFVTFAAVLVVAVSLTLFGSVLLLRSAITRSTNLLTHQVEVAVFLTPDVSADERKQLQTDLLAMPEVRSVIYMSKQDAYNNFKELFRDEPDIVANTSADALPESFRVKLKDPRTFSVIRDRLADRPGVLQIRDERELLKQVFAFANALRLAALVIALVVGIAALVLIATTIRMAIHARRKEIGIMKLVGATNWFIRVPFLLEGIVQGLLGAAVALVLLMGSKPILTRMLSSLNSVGFRISYVDVLAFGGYLLVAGMIFGALGSLVGLRSFLDV